MTLREKLGQLLIVGIEGTELTSAEEKFLVSHNIGGVILMGRNVKTPEQVHRLCSAIQNLRQKTRSKTPFFISIDMEGGRVARLKEPFTQWPPMARLGELNSPNLAFHFASVMGRELSAVGINLDFAPCVDVLTNSQNTAIGDRALSHDPEAVARLSSALVRGFIKANIINCAKHFPGHGNTVVDSHEDLPVEDLNLERLHSTELVPFKKAIRSRVDLIMMSHILFKNIDSKYPASLSEILIQKLLREELRFRGLVITDDLDMKALTKNFSLSEIPVRAVEAGCDLLLYCNDPTVPPQALSALEEAVDNGRLSLGRIEESYQRVLKLKSDSLSATTLMPWSAAQKIIGTEEHLKLAKAIRDGKIPEELTERE